MLLNAKNGRIYTEEMTMDYVSFGRGKNILILLPGVGDGLISVKGKALFFALAYKEFSKDYTLFIFSRKNNITSNYSTRDMAKDQAQAMKALGISQAHVIGVSQGGMIAQYLAIDYPELIRKLVLVVTTARPNENLKQVINHWISLAKNKKYKALMMDSAQKSYSDQYFQKNRFFYFLLGSIGKPKNFERFIFQANSCLQHDSYSMLDSIQCETLIVGGECDQIVGKEASIELATQIKKSKLFLYPFLGHALYEEAKDFKKKIIEFLEK